MVGPPKRDEAREAEVQQGPTNCGARGRAEDAADVVREMASAMRRFDHDVVKRIVIARNAANNIHAAFPEGDQRFQDSDDDNDDERVENLAGQGDSDNESEDDTQEGCHGLLDMAMDKGPLQCLRRAKEDYEFDLVAELDAAGCDFFERIRVANFIRKQVKGGQEGNDIVKSTRNLLLARDDSVLKDNALLEPVIESDLLLTVLESEEQVEADDSAEEKAVSHAVESSLREENILS